MEEVKVLGYKNHQTALLILCIDNERDLNEKIKRLPRRLDTLLEVWAIIPANLKKGHGLTLKGVSAEEIVKHVRAMWDEAHPSAEPRLCGNCQSPTDEEGICHECVYEEPTLQAWMKERYSIPELTLTAVLHYGGIAPAVVALRREANHGFSTKDLWDYIRTELEQVAYTPLDQCRADRAPLAAMMLDGWIKPA